MIKAVFFDMNETMLNLNLLQKSFSKYFDHDYIMKYWFVKLLHSSTVMGIMGEYENFGKLSEVTLESVFKETGKEWSEDAKKDILGAFKSLSAYEDVPKALSYLKKKNIKVIAVSNSSLEMMKEQLKNGGIESYFDDCYSVDSVEKYKPFKNIYEYVINQTNINAEEAAMVACHDWDLFGAKKAGLTTCYIQRKMDLYNPYFEKPDYQGDDMLELMQQLF